VEASEAIIENWWRQEMMGGAKAHYDGILAFSQTDFTEDLKKITVPVLVMHGDDDQTFPTPTPDHCPRGSCRTGR
jgi:non-heme chloroperoxidase